jgi:hypothetical protein
MTDFMMYAKWPWPRITFEFQNTFFIIFTKGNISLCKWVILMDLIYSLNITTVKSLDLLSLFIHVSEGFQTEH